MKTYVAENCVAQLSATIKNFEKVRAPLRLHNPPDRTRRPLFVHSRKFVDNIRILQPTGINRRLAESESNGYFYCNKEPHLCFDCYSLASDAASMVRPRRAQPIVFWKRIARLAAASNAELPACGEEQILALPLFRRRDRRDRDNRPR